MVSSLWERIPTELIQWWADTFSTRKLQCVAIAVLGVLTAVALLAPRSHDRMPASSDLFEGRNLTTSEIELVEVALGNAGLNEYQLDSGHIVVPAGRRGEFLAAIREANALPDSFHTPVKQAINNSSFIESSRQQSQRLHHALEEKAGLAIRELPGIRDAFVNFDSTSGNTFRNDAKVTAVVGVKTAHAQPLDERGFRTIQAMVMGFRAGLEAENVTVTDLTSGNFYRGSMGEADKQALMAIRRVELERVWQRKLQSAIPFAKGATIAVNVVGTDDMSQAKSVSCSVSMPRPPKSRNVDNEAMKRQIQSAILPLIGTQVPNSVAVDELIAVTMFDEVATVQVDQRSSRRFVVALLCGGGAIFLVALLLIEPKSTTQSEPETELRIYAAKDPNIELAMDDAEELRSLAQQDPDAVARSLSDLIDRAS